MGTINLKISLGTVNYTDFLHVTASKVSDPGTVVWEQWIDVPVSNYLFVIPNLDPANYYITYYDAPDNSSLGSLVTQMFVNALTGDTLYERRFYRVNGGGAADPVAGDSTITDPYLIGKNVTGTFKEAFRYLKPDEEYSFDDAAGEISVLNNTQFDDQELFIVEIKYAVGNSSSTPSGGMYQGTITVTEAARTLLAADVDKRVRLLGTAATQVITLCTLASISAERGFYFDNSVGGTAAQVKLVLPGTDKIKYSGFALSSGVIDFPEFWVGKGEHLLIRKMINDDASANWWEVLTDYRGVAVGEKITVGFKGHPNTITENGQLIDGDQYPRLWWWVNNVLPATHKYFDSSVESEPYSYTSNLPPAYLAIGQFILNTDPTKKKFRMPKTSGFSERALANFETYGTDTANRPVDFPGGEQNEMVGPHTHGITFDQSNDNLGGSGWVATSNGAVGGAAANQHANILQNQATENRVKNIGVIYARRI